LLELTSDWEPIMRMIFYKLQGPTLR
jgi:hypothetical protein